MFHIGIDIGGTFTDRVLIGEDENGTVPYRAAQVGLRLATELIRAGDAPAADMALAAGEPALAGASA